MKALLRIFRPSRKLFIIVGGIALLAGASGTAALFIGKDRLLGEVLEANNGLECTDVNLVTIRKQDRFWIRKYIKTEPTDGETRVKTALRVAKAIYDAQKPDLVQVVVLDRNGPSLRSDIRGRAIGADVVFIPHPEKMIEGVNPQSYTAKYYNGEASDEGLFFGERIEMPLQDIEHISSALKDHSDCEDPMVAAASPGASGGHGASSGGKAAEGKESSGAEGGGHAAPAGEEAPAEGPPPDEEGEQPAQKHESQPEKAPGTDQESTGSVTSQKRTDENAPGTREASAGRASQPDAKSVQATN